MAKRTFNLRCTLIVAAAFAALATGAIAQTSPNFGKLPDAEIAAFKANPQSLLTSHASAGLPLSTEVRSLILTDPNLVDMIIDAAKNGNDAQKAAIGAGLAEASRILARSSPLTAATIQQKVAASGLSPLITAYIAGSNGTETAAVGGGGGGGGGGSGPTGGVGGVGGANGGANPGGSSFGSGNGFTGFSSGTLNGGSSTFTTNSSSPAT